MIATLRQWILAKLLRPEQLALVEALDAPVRWMPIQPLTDDEMQKWEQVVTSPLGLRIDLTVGNWALQVQQSALQAPPDQLARQAGYAIGCRAGWEMAKSLSRMTAAEGRQPEDGATTAAPDLDHLQP